MVSFLSEDSRRGYFHSQRSSSQLVLVVTPSFWNRRCGRRDQYRLNLRLTRTSAQMLLIGLCLGVTLGIMFVPHDMVYCDFQASEAGKLPDYPVRSSSPPASLGSPELKNNSEIKFRRPRYFSTELGLRKKLLAGVIITKQTDEAVLIGINQTLATRVDKLLFFVSGSGSEDFMIRVKKLGLTSVIHIFDNKTSASAGRVALKVVEYFGEKLAEQFDYFFLILDKFWVNGRLLMETVSRLSITEDFVMGVPKNDFCSLEHGLIMSRRIVKKFSTSAHNCPTDLLGRVHIITLGKCFRNLFRSNFPCESTIQGITYVTAQPKSSGSIAYDAIAVGPVRSASEFYGIHARVSKIRLGKTRQLIAAAQDKFQLILPKIPVEFQRSSWPIGIHPSFHPPTRFEVIPWTYFNPQQVFGLRNKVISKIHGVNQMDFDLVVNSTLSFLKLQGFPESRNLRLRNGYSRFDPTRGMEYILDMRDKDNVTVRVEGIRPVTKMELVPMPFVTENQRVTILVPIRTENVVEIRSFLDRFFDFSTDRKENTVLVFAILTPKTESSRGLKPKQVEEVKKLITKYNSKGMKRGLTEGVRAGYILIPMKKGVSSALQASVEAVIRRIVGTTALILTADTSVSFKDEFLNRVRMNTVLNTQVFSPIPFVEYNPSVYLGKPKAKSDADFEVNKNSGYFDTRIFRYFSFYAADYLAARKALAGRRTVLAEMESRVDFSTLVHLFLRLSPLHLFRAPEPSLKIPFSFPTGCSNFQDCVKTRWGSRGQLGKLILQQMPSPKSRTL